MIRKLATRRTLTALAFLAPSLAVMALVAGWPLLRTIGLSFTDASLASVEAPAWIGFANYWSQEKGVSFGVLADPDWWRAVINTLGFTIISVSVETILGIGVALLLNVPSRWRAVFRASVLVPWAIPTIVSAKIWSWMLNDQLGVINTLLVRSGLIEQPVAWLALPQYAFWAVIWVDVWKTTPFMALLLLAGLQNIPADCYEAARLDGASAWQQFWRITLPLLRPALVVAAIFRMLDAMRIFDLIYVLTSNSTDTMTMAVYSRQQLIDFQEAGYGSASSTLLFLLIFGLTFAYLRGLKVNLDGAR